MLAPDNARMLYSLRSQLEIVVVYGANDSSHFGGAFQMDRIVNSQLSSNDINSLRAQLL